MEMGVVITNDVGTRGSFGIPILSPSQKDSLSSPNRQKYIPSPDFFENNTDFYFQNVQ